MSDLTRTIRDRAGKTLKTRAAATRYVLRMLKARPRYRSWICAGELLRDGAPAEAVTSQIEFALYHQCGLDVRFTNDQVRRFSPQPPLSTA